MLQFRIFMTRSVTASAMLLGLITATVSSASGVSQTTLLSSVGGGKVGVSLPDGTYVWAEPGYGNYSIQLKQLNASGTTSQWSSGGPATNGGGTMSAFNLVRDAQGSIYLIGKFSGTFKSSCVTCGSFQGYTYAQSQGFYVAKYLSNGTFAWVNPSSYLGYDPVSTIDKDGNLLLLVQDGLMEFRVKKISSSGATTWMTSFAGPTASHYGNNMAISTDLSGNIFIACSLGDGPDRDDVLVTALDSSGNVTSSQSFSTGGRAVHQFFGATLPGFESGMFVSSLFTNAEGTPTVRGGGLIVFTIDENGLLADSVLYNTVGFYVTSLSVGLNGSLYVGGDHCRTSSGCLQRIIKFNNTLLEWDAFYDGTDPDSQLAVSQVHQVFEEVDGSITFSFLQTNFSSNTYRATFPAVEAPQVLSSEASLDSALATIIGTVLTGNLSTSVDCLISSTADFQEIQTVSAGDDFTSDGAFLCRPMNLQLGERYYFKTVAVNSLGSFTSPTKIVSIPNVPSTPSLEVSLSNRTVSLSFATPNDNGMPLQSMTLQRRFDSNSWSNLAVLNPTAESTQTYSEEVSISDAGKLASYRLFASNSVGDSNYSNQVSIALPTVPNSPTSISASGDDSGITISWADPVNITTSGALSYLFQVTNNGITWESFEPSIYTSTRSVQFDSAIGGINYRFRVKAINAFGESEWSASSNLSQITSTYTIALNYDNATSGNTIQFETYTEGRSGISLPTPSRTGFTFGGWFDNQALRGRPIISPYTPTHSHTVYAKWTQKPVKATSSVKPNVVGVARVNKILVAKSGSWSGYPTPKLSYQWYTCSSAISSPRTSVPNTCKKISGATNTSIKIVSAQKGKFVAVLVTGSSVGTTPTIWLSKSTNKIG